MKKTLLIMMLCALALGLTGCFVQPDPTLDALTVNDGTVPFGTVQPLPTDLPTPTPEPEPTATPDNWRAIDQSVWEDWSAGTLPTTTPRTAATAAPDAESWSTSTQDYNAGYPVLRIGSVGEDVSDLQARLTELGYFTGVIDGKYSTLTHDAVAEFQERNGLTADGIAGRQTQDLLYSGAAQAKTVSASGSSEEYILLKRGVMGLEVRKLQGRLAELGYYAGGVDGIYNEKTESAVKAFQRNNGLSADGQAGAQTQAKIYGSSAKYAANPVTTANPDAVRELSVGMTGNDVYALQTRLIELRYLDGVADGVFGTETENALRDFQKNNGLTVDGKAGSATQRKLAGNCKASTKSQTGSNSAALREGDSGEAVYVLQARLFELGYYNGRIDGRFGAETTEAVIAFQRANGLGADGVVGSGTQNRLDSGKAVTATAPVVESTMTANTGLTTMRRGNQGGEVLVLQQYLADLGYLSATPDGQFGAATERAVKLFQEANGLTADGIAGTGTLSILYSGTAVRYNQFFGPNAQSKQEQQNKPTATPTPRPNTNIIIQWESQGDDVLQYQRRLVQLGYLTSKNATGKFNQPTVDATKAFQQMNGLKVDGAAGPESLRLIYSEKAINASGNMVGY